MSDTTNKLEKIGGNLKGVVDAFRDGRPQVRVLVPAGALGKARTKVVYGNYVHGVARSAADVMELVPGLFPQAPFKPDDVRALEERVRADGIVLMQVESTVESIKADHSAGKDQLCDVVTVVRDTVLAAWNNPLTPEDTRARLAVHAAPLLELVQEHNDQISDRRAANQALRDAADAQVQQAESAAAAARLTTAIVRGADAPAEPTAGRRSRRG